MSTSHDEQDPIRLYLLGNLDERGKDAFEQRLFADDEFLEEVMAAEDQLIDDFLTGDLTPDEVAMFEKNFLVTEERRQKLRLGKTLRTYAKQAIVPVAKAKTSPARWNWRQWFSPSILRPASSMRSGPTIRRRRWSCSGTASAGWWRRASSPARWRPRRPGRGRSTRC